MLRPPFTITQRLPVADLPPLLRFPEIFLIAKDERGNDAVFELATMPSHLFAVWLRQVVINEHAYGVVATYIVATWTLTDKWRVLNALAEGTGAGVMATYLFGSRTRALRAMHAMYETVETTAVSYMACANVLTRTQTP